MKAILNKLNLIMAETGIIEKDKKNTFHNYEYASEFAIKKALHGLLVKHKVIFTVSTKNKQVEIYQTDKGKRNGITDLEITYTFYDVDTAESLSGLFIGTGSDGEDKGTYKALTGAIKYILTTTFLIPTGDDPEKHEGETPVKESTPQAKPQPTDDKQWLNDNTENFNKVVAYIKGGGDKSEVFKKYKISKEILEKLDKAIK